MDKKYNMKNPAVKRILQELKEMQNNPSDEYMSLPLEDNIFEWQFAIRGPSDTEFEGGIYHGRIQLPPEYPFKPPAFMLLTPNGRFETQTKICLSISQHHPEHWQPSWSVRTALVALIAFMPTKPDGALGSLDYTKEERRTLAIKSRNVAPKFGTPERQTVIDEIHEHLMKKLPPVPELPATNGVAEASDEAKEEERIEQTEESPIEDEPQRNSVVQNGHELHVDANAGPIAVSFSAGFQMTTQALPAVAAAPAGQQQPQLVQQVAGPGVVAPGRFTIYQTSSEFGLTFLAIGLTVAILALFIKKLMNLSGVMPGFTQ